MIRKARICAVALASTVGLMPAPAHANDGAFHGEGATVFAYKEHRIQMVSENIRIRHAPTQAHPDAEWEADCTFEFENLTDDPLTIQMGFPESRSFPSGAWSIREFRTLIQGKQVHAAHKTIEREQSTSILEQLRTPPKRPGARGPGLGGGKEPAQTPKAQPPVPDPWVGMARGVKQRMNLSFDAAYTWPVAFAPRERIVVKNRYRFGGAGTNGPIGLCLEKRSSPGGQFWHASPPRTGLGAGPCSEVTYVVTSGKTWVAPIGEATIEIDIPPGISPNHVIPLPPATEITATTVKWHYKNFLPKDELRVLFATSMHDEEDDDAPRGSSVDFSEADQVKDWLAFAKANGARPELIRRMRDIQAYSFGVREAGAPAPGIFGEWSPPKVKEARALGMLSPSQRQILDLLEAAAR